MAFCSVPPPGFLGSEGWRTRGRTGLSEAVGVCGGVLLQGQDQGEESEALTSGATFNNQKLSHQDGEYFNAVFFFKSRLMQTNL